MQIKLRYLTFCAVLRKHNGSKFIGTTHSFSFELFTDRTDEDEVGGRVLFTLFTVALSTAVVLEGLVLVAAALTVCA